MSVKDIIDRVIYLRSRNQKVVALEEPYIFDFNEGQLFVDGVEVGGGGGLTAEGARDIVGDILVGGTNIDITVDDLGNTVTIDGAATTLTVDDGTTEVNTVDTVMFDASEFTVTDGGGGTAVINMDFGTTSDKPAAGDHTHTLIEHNHDADYVEITGDTMTGDLINTSHIIVDTPGNWAGLGLDGQSQGGSVDFAKNGAYQGSIYSDAGNYIRICNATNDAISVAPDGTTTFAFEVAVPDEAYGVGWNGDLSVPTKNALYDKIETISAGGSALTVDDDGTTEVENVTWITFDGDEFNVIDSGFPGTIGIELDYGTTAGTPAEGDHAHDATYVNVTGDTMTGNLVIDVDSIGGSVTVGGNSGGEVALTASGVYQGGIYSDSSGNIVISTDDEAVVFVDTTTNKTTFADDVIVVDEAYGVGWNASLEVPTKNAVYDKVEALDASVVHDTGNETIAGIKTFTSDIIVDVAGASADLTLDGTTDGGQVAFRKAGVDQAFIYTDASNSMTVNVDTINMVLNAGTGAVEIDAPVTVPDEAYGAGWNASLEVPTKNAIYDKIETMGGGVTAEDVRDTIGTALVAGNNIDITVSDGSDTITIDVEALTVGDVSGAAPLASPTFTGTVTLPVGLTGVIRTDTGVVSVDTDVTDIVTAASTAAAGKVELATDAETNTGTDTARAITPSNLEAWTGSDQITTVGTLASPTLTTPTIASFTNSQHNHTNAAGGGTITVAAISDIASTYQPLDTELTLLAADTVITGHVGLVTVHQYVRIDAARNLVDDNSVQPVFPTTEDALTVVAGMTYRWRMTYDITKGVNNISVRPNFAGGTATFTTFKYSSVARMSTVGGGNNGNFLQTATTATTVIVAGSASVNFLALCDGEFEVNAGGTFIPAIALSGASGSTPTVNINTWCEVWAVGANPVTKIGPWA